MKGAIAALIAVYLIDGVHSEENSRGGNLRTPRVKSHSSQKASVGRLARSQCFEGGHELELTLPGNKEVDVPALPTSEEKYAYASQHALVAIPSKCYSLFKDKIKRNTTLVDRGAKTGTAYFFIKDLIGGYKTLAAMGSCACGLVVEMHGSGGPGWDAVQFAAMFSNMGFVQVMPNSMAMPADLGLKGREHMKDINDIDTSNYCGSYRAFEGTCREFNKPYCYSTKVENILADTTKYRKFVEGVYQIRKREIDYFVDSNLFLLKAFDKAYLVGNSEGGMAASRYHHPALDQVLAGRIISAWSCDFNYFVSCAAHAQVCEDKCRKDVPQLNLIGTNDEYFGAIDYSVASIVANASHGYGGPITGNCMATYQKQRFEKSTVVVHENTEHGPEYSNDNVWRSVIADFLSHAGSEASTWKSLRTCTLQKGVYTCPRDGPRTCLTIDGKYQLNPKATDAPASSFTCVV